MKKVLNELLNISLFHQQILEFVENHKMQDQFTVIFSTLI